MGAVQNDRLDDFTGGSQVIASVGEQECIEVVGKEWRAVINAARQSLGEDVSRTIIYISRIAAIATWSDGSTPFLGRPGSISAFVCSPSSETKRAFEGGFEGRRKM